MYTYFDKFFGVEKKKKKIVLNAYFFIKFFLI